MSAIYRKELKSMFSNMTGVVFIAWVLAWIGYYIRMYMLDGYYTEFEFVCVASPFLAFLVIPILTMRSFSEEKHARTDQLLYSLPVKTSGIVMGKFLSMVTVLALPLAVVAVYPPLLRMYGNVSLSTAYAALLGMFFLGCALIAVCMFISSLTESQIIAAVLSFGVVILTYEISSIAGSMSNEATTSLIGTLIMAALLGFLVYLLTKNWLMTLVVGGLGCGVTILFYAVDPTRYEGFVPGLLMKIGLFYRMVNFGYGIVDLTVIVYYLSVVALFLFFTAQSLEKKRWS